MTEPVSEATRVLGLIQRQKYSEDQAKNLIELNSSMAYISDYLMVMQQGVDDANKDIIQKFGDFVDEMIILFSGGTGLDFGLDALKPFFDNLGSIFGLDDLMGNVGENPIIGFINSMIANLVDAINGVTGGIFNLGPLADSLRGTKEAAQEAVDKADEALGSANSILPVIRQITTDVETISAPFSNTWETMVPGQQVSFPRALLNSSVKNQVGDTSSGVPAALEQTIVIGDSQDANVYIHYTREPKYYPSVNQVESAYVLSNYAVGRSTVTFIVEAVTGSPCALYVYISRMLPNGNIKIEWVSPNQTPLMTNARSERTISLPEPQEIPFDINEYMVISIHQFGAGTVRPLIGLEMSSIGRSSDFFPPQQKMHVSSSSLLTVGTQIAKASQIFTSNFVPWVGIGQRLLTGDPLPRLWYDDFERAEISNKWSSVGDRSIYIYGGAFSYLRGTLPPDGTARGLYNQPMNYDDQRVTGQISGQAGGVLTQEPAKLILRANAAGNTFFSLDVRDAGVTFAKMTNGTITTLGAFSVTNAVGEWFRVEVVGNTFVASKKTTAATTWTEVLRYVDTGGAISAGEGFRYCGASVQRNSFFTSGGWNNWQAEDLVEVA